MRFALGKPRFSGIANLENSSFLLNLSKHEGGPLTFWGRPFALYGHFFVVFLFVDDCCAGLVLGFF